MILQDLVRTEDDNIIELVEIKDDDFRDMLDIYTENWLDMLCATDKKTFDFYSEQIKRIDKILYHEKRKLYLHLYNTSEEVKFRRRMPSEFCKKGGRKRLFNTLEERKEYERKYQHNYYLNITKPKRKKNNEVKLKKGGEE